MEQSRWEKLVRSSNQLTMFGVLYLLSSILAIAAAVTRDMLSDYYIVSAAAIISYVAVIKFRPVPNRLFAAFLAAFLTPVWTATTYLLNDGSMRGGGVLLSVCLLFGIIVLLALVREDLS